MYYSCPNRSVVDKQANGEVFRKREALYVGTIKIHPHQHSPRVKFRLRKRGPNSERRSLWIVSIRRLLAAMKDLALSGAARNIVEIPGWSELPRYGSSSS